MSETPLVSHATLPAVLATRARAASDSRLALDVAVGLVVAACVVIWHPRGWLLLVSAALGLAAFGAWGIADREITGHSGVGGAPIVYALRALRGMAAVTGMLAMLGACFAVLGLMLGTWIS